MEVPDGVSPLQGADCVLQAAHEARESDMPTFLAQMDLKKAFDHVGRNKAPEALGEHEVRRQHTAWTSELWEQHPLEMRLGPHSSE